VVAAVSIPLYGVREGFGAYSARYRSLPFFDAWIRWDARWYEKIATEGYSFSNQAQSAVAFFPLYPLLMRMAGWLGVDPVLAGIFITVLCGFAATLLFRRWTGLFADERTAELATWLLVLWPFAFFLFGAVYSDALFLLLVVGAFFSLEKERVWVATLLGAMATATRPVAPAVVLGLLIRQLELARRGGRHFRLADFAPALSVAGLLAYMAFQYARFGTPLAFLETQVGWQQDPGWHAWLKLDFFRSKDFPLYAARAALHAALSVGFLALAIPTWKRLGAGYGVYALAMMGTPFISSYGFIGLGRYAIAAFPCFLTLALLLKTRPRARLVWMITSTALLVIMTSKFAVGRYVS